MTSKGKTAVEIPWFLEMTADLHIQHTDQNIQNMPSHDTMRCLVNSPRRPANLAPARLVYKRTGLGQSEWAPICYKISRKPLWANQPGHILKTDISRVRGCPADEWRPRMQDIARQRISHRLSTATIHTAGKAPAETVAAKTCCPEPAAQHGSGSQHACSVFRKAMSVLSAKLGFARVRTSEQNYHTESLRGALMLKCILRHYIHHQCRCSHIRGAQKLQPERSAPGVRHIRWIPRTTRREAQTTSPDLHKMVAEAPSLRINSGVYRTRSGANVCMLRKHHSNPSGQRGDSSEILEEA